MKKYLSILLAAAVVTGLAGCGGSNTGTTQAPATQASESKAPDAQADTQADDAEETEASGTGDFHIGIVTGSVSQSEDDRRGAEAFQAMYGEDMVKLAIYPDNFTEELETTIQTIVNLSDDPQMKAIIVNQSVPGTTEAFRKIKESRPDIICIAGEGHEDLPEIGSRCCRPGQLRCQSQEDPHVPRRQYRECQGGFL